MNNETIEITERLIEAGQSEAGGWNQAQLELLGVRWPPKRGWKRRIRGSLMLRVKAARFLALRGVTKKHQKQSAHLTDLLLNFDAT